MWPAIQTTNSIPYAFPNTAENKKITNDALGRQVSMVVQGCIAYRAAETEHFSRFRFFLRDTDGLPVTQWHFNADIAGNEAN